MSRINTVTPLRVKLARAFVRLTLLFIYLVLIVLGTVAAIAAINYRQAQLDNAFLQGMTAGHQLCPRGI